MITNFQRLVAAKVTLALIVCIVAGPAMAHDHGETSGPRFTAETVFALEYADDPQISPQGTTIAYVRKSMDRMTDQVVGDIWTLDTQSGTHLPLITAQGSLSSPRWSPDGQRLMYMGRSEGGRPDLRIYLMDQGRSYSLGQFDSAPRGAVWSPDGSTIAFAAFIDGETPRFADALSAPEGANWAEPVRVFDDITIRADGRGYVENGASELFVVPAEGGTARQVTDSEQGFSGVQWLDGDTLLAVGNMADDADLDPIESEIYRIDIASGTVAALTSRNGPDSTARVSPNGTAIAYLGFDDAVRAYQQTDLYIMGTDGSEVQNLTADFDRSIGAITWSPNGDAIIASVDQDGDGTLVSFPVNGSAHTTLVTDLGGTSIGRPYSGGSFSVGQVRERRRARALYAYTRGSPDRPAEIALIRGNDDPVTLTDLNDDALGHIALATIEEFTVTSPVGELPIEAWVALPPDFKADGSFPLVLEIHGGPFAMYGPTFAAEIQRFAAEGYVTVYVNPRGSTGYGEAFAQEIDLAYPGNDYDDLMAVIDDLVARQYADPGRLFVTGGSGGGVLTAWTVGKTDRFAAAASIKPVINWTTMALAADANIFFARHWMQAMPWENPERYWSLSPLSIVGNVTTPTLMMVGEEDWRTPTWEAEQFYTALKMQGVDTALIRIPGASHSIASRPSRLNAKVDNIMGWFANYDPGKRNMDAGGDTAGQ